jgi:hypothetical protein
VELGGEMESVWQFELSFIVECIWMFLVNHHWSFVCFY